jgi:AraC family transcriptional regulator
MGIKDKEQAMSEKTPNPMTPGRMIHPNDGDKYLSNAEILANSNTDRVFFRDYRMNTSHIVAPGMDSLRILIHRHPLGLLRRRFDEGWKEGPARAGDVAIIGVGRTSEWEIPDTKINPSHWDLTRIYFSNELMTNVAASAFERDYNKIEAIDAINTADRELLRLGDMLIQEMRSADSGRGLAIDYLACLMGIHLIRRHHHNCAVPEIIRDDGRLTAVQKARVLEFMKANLARNIRMLELAELAGLSEVQFLYRFKTTFGGTPSQYFLNQRVRLAVERIRRTEMTLAEIARITGYSDQAHMTREVKKAIGQTPGALRRS